jgi:hypothetical protein
MIDALLDQRVCETVEVAWECVPAEWSYQAPFSNTTVGVFGTAESACLT